MTDVKTAADYLAIIFVGGGSSWGRSPDKEKAIANAIKNFRDWRQLFEVDGVEVKVNVIDVQGYSDAHWGSYPDGWLHGTNEATGKDEVIERANDIITRTTPKRKVRA
jgi:hypothetical protein